MQCKTVLKPIGGSNEPEKQFFVIVSPEEAKLLQSVPDDDPVKAPLRALICTLNSASTKWFHFLTNEMNNSKEQRKSEAKASLPTTFFPSRVWQTITEYFDEDLVPKNKEEILESASRYLETANKLQKPKGGQVERVVIKQINKLAESHVNVYQAFWQLIRQLQLNAFLQEIKPDHIKALSQEKAYIFVLLNIRTNDLPSLNLAPADQKNAVAMIDILVGNLRNQAKLEIGFTLSQQEQCDANILYNNFKNRFASIEQLRLEFENTPQFARYVHLRPALLIQIAQALEHCFNSIEAIGAPRFLYRWVISSVNKYAEILAVLKLKLKEVIISLAFQERIKSLFGHDDFIEIIHRLLANATPKFLPTHAFFVREDQWTIELFLYDKSDASAPKIIAKADHSKWRKEFILKHGCADAKALMTIEKKPQPQVVTTPPISLSTVAMVRNRDCSTLVLPTVVAPALLEQKTTYNELQKFFIAAAHKRELFFKLNQHEEMVDTMIAEHKLPFTLENEETEVRTAKTENLFLRLIIAIQLIETELTELAAAMKDTKEKTELKFFETYHDQVALTKDVFRVKVSHFLLTWINDLANPVIPLAQSLKKLVHTINDAEVTQAFAERMTR